jgi:hypothetical protein
MSSNQNTERRSLAERKLEGKAKSGIDPRKRLEEVLARKTELTKRLKERLDAAKSKAAPKGKATHSNLDGQPDHQTNEG